jgi:hypothetical protein
MPMFAIFRRSWVAWVKYISGAPDLFFLVGTITVVFFAPAVAMLTAEMIYHTEDLFPRPEILLPGAIIFSSFFLLAGGFLIFCSIRYSATPGSLLYRLTHLGWRKR